MGLLPSVTLGVNDLMIWVILLMQEIKSNRYTAPLMYQLTITLKNVSNFEDVAIFGSINNIFEHTNAIAT